MRLRNKGSPMHCAIAPTIWCPTVWNMKLSSSSTVSSRGNKLARAMICFFFGPKQSLSYYDQYNTHPENWNVIGFLVAWSKLLVCTHLVTKVHTSLHGIAAILAPTHKCHHLHPSLPLFSCCSSSSSSSLPLLLISVSKLYSQSFKVQQTHSDSAAIAPQSFLNKSTQESLRMLASAAPSQTSGQNRQNFTKPISQKKH